jgi:hypothetical protein
MTRSKISLQSSGYSEYRVELMSVPDFTAAAPPSTALQHRSMDSPVRMPSPVRILAFSADSIVEECREAFPLAASRASAEVSTGVRDSTVAAVEGKAVQLPQTRLMIRRKNSCAYTT